MKPREEILTRLKTQLSPKFPGEELEELIEWAGRLIDQLPDEPTAADEELIRSAVVAGLLERKATRRLARDGAFSADTGEPKEVLDRVARLIQLKGTVLRQLKPSASRKRAAAERKEIDDFRASWAQDLAAEEAAEAAPAAPAPPATDASADETPTQPEPAESRVEPAAEPSAVPAEDAPYSDAPPWESAP